MFCWGWPWHGEGGGQQNPFPTQELPLCCVSELRDMANAFGLDCPAWDPSSSPSPNRLLRFLMLFWSSFGFGGGGGNGGFIIKCNVKTVTSKRASSARDCLGRPQQNEQVEWWRVTLTELFGWIKYMSFTVLHTPANPPGNTWGIYTIQVSPGCFEVLQDEEYYLGNFNFFFSISFFLPWGRIPFL